MKDLLFIADDHPVVVSGVTNLLSPYFREIVCFSNSKDLIIGLQSQIPTVLFLDVNFPDGSGIDILKLIKKNQWNTQVIIFTMYNSGVLLTKCKQYGAAAYLLKTALDSEILEALSSDEFYIGENVNEICNDDFNETDFISEREKEILHCFALDMSVKEISDSLNISEFTIHTHRRNLKRKFKVNTISGMVSEGFKSGVIKI